ncbi:MAG: OmpA family protein, partial [Betaproteobacteria bacterium]
MPGLAGRAPQTASGVGPGREEGVGAFPARVCGYRQCPTGCGPILPYGLGKITFSTGSADPKASFLKVLDGVALVRKKYNKTIVEVDGHTDSVGKPDYNQKLSERRATALAQSLIGKGIKQERTITVGAAETRPVASNVTES